MSINRKDLIYVSIQGTLFVLYVFVPNFWTFTLPKLVTYIASTIVLVGILIFFLGLLQLKKNLTPFPSPKQDSQLVTNGIYSIMRHPIYTGIFLSAFGYSVHDLNFLRLTISLMLILLFYFKSVYEENLLVQKFPEYKSYQKSTARFFPFTLKQQ